MPSLAGEALIADIERTTTGPRQAALWWLGQHSFVVKAGAQIVYHDPFLTPMPERLVPPLLTPAQLAHADVICGSHDHGDHIDRPVWPELARTAGRAQFLLPDLLRARISEELSIPLSRLTGLDDGVSVNVGGMRITGIAAAHEMLDRDATSGRYPYLGFVFEANGCSWYHAGDTCWYEGLQTRLRHWRFDFMLLPINGRDANRLASGIIGNMTYQEAADLAGPLAPQCVIPSHYEMFAANRGDPVAFRDYMAVKYPHVPTHICRHGERVLLGRG